MEIKAGTRISYVCAYGERTATVLGIRMGLSSANTMQPWMMIQIDGKNNKFEIHCDDSSLKMFKVAVLDN